MATTITAGNATNGAAISSDNTGILELKTGTGAGTTAMTVNASQNVGINVASPTYRIEAYGSTPAFFGTNSTDGTRFGYTASLPSNSGNCYVGWIPDSVGTAGVNGDLALVPRTSAGANIRFFTGTTSASERMRLDASGRLLIGDTTSRSNLAIGQAQVQIASASFSTFSMFGNANNTDGSYIALSKARGGTLGGTTAVQSGDILGGIFFEGYNGTGFATAAQIYTKVDGTVSGSQMPGRLEFYTTPTGSNSAVERARIAADGKVSIGGGTEGGVKLQIIGEGNTNGSFSIYCRDSGNTARFAVGNGGTLYATSTTISSISDQRLKENIVNLDVGLAEIMALQPRKFDWKEGQGKDIKGDRGFIAQEVEQVFPELIDEWIDAAPEGEEPYKSVRQDLIPVLVKAIQELKAELDATKAEVAALKGEA